VITPEIDKGRVRNRKAVIHAFILVILFNKNLFFCFGSIRKSNLRVKR